LLLFRVKDGFFRSFLLLVLLLARTTPKPPRGSIPFFSLALSLPGGKAAERGRITTKSSARQAVLAGCAHVSRVVGGIFIVVVFVFVSSPLGEIRLCRLFITSILQRRRLLRSVRSGFPHDDAKRSRVRAFLRVCISFQ
jgi:heme exporter protein D